MSAKDKGGIVVTDDEVNAARIDAGHFPTLRAAAVAFGNVFTPTRS